MKDVRPIISKNLVNLRKSNNLTQSELAEKLNYSDKAISRWENADTLPSINVLYELCDFYNVTLNDLVNEEFDLPEEKPRTRNSLSYRIWLCITVGASIWLFATLMYLYALSLPGKNIWTVFVWALPISLIGVRLTERGWFNNLAKFILNIIIIVGIVSSLYLQILVSSDFRYNLWAIFLMIIPLELLVFLSYKLKQYKK